MVQMLVQTLILRYNKPIEGMVDNIGVTAPLAFLASVIIQILNNYTKIFITDIELIFSLSTLVILDLITGIYASWAKNIEINSFGLRSSVVKIIEYFLALVSFTIISNMHESLSWIQTWAFIFLCFVELKSIQENVFLKNTATRKLFSQFWKVLKKRNDINLDE